MFARRTLLAVLVTLGLFAGLAPAAHADSTTSTYVVQFKKTISASSVASSLGPDAKVLSHVHRAIVKMTAAKAASLSNNPNVVSVSKDIKVKGTGVETNAPWDLDLLDNRVGTKDQTYNYPNAGAGVTVYVIDSGLAPTHTEFASASILPGVNFVVKSDPATSCGAGKPQDSTVDPADTLDRAGHGTAVSSLIVGAKDGVAKGATIVPIRILDCDGVGYGSDYDLAVDWIIANHAPGTPAIANVSLGGQGDGLNASTQALIDAGVSVVVAAGNANVDACTETPASTPAAITAAAVNASLAEPVWQFGQSTNWGSCVDLYAPGDHVVVADYNVLVNGQAQADGTSFSSPLIAGAAAQVLADHPTWKPAQVAADLSNRATFGLVTGSHTCPATVTTSTCLSLSPNLSPNKLLNVGPLGTFATATTSIDAASGMIGETVTAVTSWSPTPTAMTYAWSRNGTVIPQQVGSTYVLTPADAGQPITVTVTASREGYATPTLVTSAAIFPVNGLPMIPGTPTIAGSAAVSCVLTGVPGTWDPADATLTYVWFRDGVKIDGATAATYTPVAADLGHTLSVSITGRKTDYNVATGVSVPTAAVQGSNSVLANEAFVKASYQDFLGRPPLDSEVAFQAGALSTGRVNRLNYLFGLANSDEWLTVIVTSLYQKTLGRDPEPSGLAGWVSVLRSRSLTVAQVAALFYGSPEFYQVRGGNTDATWVTELYRQILNREPDAGGLTAWTNLASSHTVGREVIAGNFYQSVESREDRVKVLYESLLKREPDPTGWPYWTNQILTAGDLQLAASLASSDEYWYQSHLRF